MVNAPTNIMRHFRRKKNFLRSQFCKFNFPKVTSWFSSTSKLYASPIAIFNILFCSLCLSPFSVHMVTTSCFPGIIKQYLPDERMLVWYQCDTVLTCGMSFFFAVLDLKMQLRPSLWRSVIDYSNIIFWLYLGWGYVKKGFRSNQRSKWQI